jgi:hypothetical protein
MKSFVPQGESGEGTTTTAPCAGKFTLEDVSNQDTGYDADVEVVYPYQYEEPDAEPAPTPAPWRTPKYLEYDEIWNSGIIDSIQTLRCESDHETHRRRRAPKAGMKRKQSAAAECRPFLPSNAVSKGPAEGRPFQNLRPTKLRRHNTKRNGTRPLQLDSSSASIDKEDSLPDSTTTSGQTSAAESVSAMAQGEPMDTSEDIACVLQRYGPCLT